MSLTSAEITAFASASVIFLTALGACVVKIIIAFRSRGPPELDSIEIVSAENIPTPPPTPPGEDDDGSSTSPPAPESFASKFRRHKANRTSPREHGVAYLSIPDAAPVLSACDIVDHLNEHMYSWMNLASWVNPRAGIFNALVKETPTPPEEARWCHSHIAGCEFCTEVVETFRDINRSRHAVLKADEHIAQVVRMVEKVNGVGYHTKGHDYGPTLRGALKSWAPFKDVTPPSFREMAVQHVSDHALTWSHFRGCNMCKAGIKEVSKSAEGYKITATQTLQKHWVMNCNGSNLLAVVLNRYLGFKPLEAAPVDPSGSDPVRTYFSPDYHSSRFCVSAVTREDAYGPDEVISVVLMEPGTRPVPPPARSPTPVLVYTPVPNPVLDAATALCELCLHSPDTAAPGPMRGKDKARASFSPY